MKLPRRNFLHLAAGAAALPAVSRLARAQTYPARPVRFIVPFPPGGSADPIARVLGNRLSEIWGQQVVIENKGGAGGNLGAQTAATAAPDGYNIFLGGAFMAKKSVPVSGIGLRSSHGFGASGKVCEFSNIMVVPNSSPVKSVREFIDHANANRGKVTYGSSGTGADPHMSTELFRKLTGIEMTHVPYRGGGPALNDVIPGRIDVYFGTLPSTLPLARNGQVRALAVTSAKRSESHPSFRPSRNQVPRATNIRPGTACTCQDASGHHSETSRRYRRGACVPTAEAAARGHRHVGNALHPGGTRRTAKI